MANQYSLVRTSEDVKTEIAADLVAKGPFPMKKVADVFGLIAF